MKGMAKRMVGMSVYCEALRVLLRDLVWGLARTWTTEKSSSYPTLESGGVLGQKCQIRLICR